MPEAFPIRRATAADIEPVRALWRAAVAAGELAGLDVQYLDRRADRLAVETEGVLVAADTGGTVAVLDADAHLLVVHLGARRQGVGRRLVEAAETAHATPESPLLLWLPDGNDGARRFFDAIDYRHHSSLWRLDLPTEVPVSPAAFPDDILQCRVDRIDIEEYVDLFNAAFRDHPSPLRVTRTQVEWAHGRPGFNPDDVLVLVESSTTRPVGFCRLSVDEHGPGSGEIDFVALLPEWRGRGLGRQLLRWGVHRLRTAGATSIFLQVEGANVTALRLYQGEGFVVGLEWRRWAAAALVRRDS